MDPAYADDTALLGDSFEAVQETLEGIERYAAAVGLRIDAAKTKVLSAQVANSQQRQLFPEGVPLEEVAAFKYLGASFIASGQTVQGIESRINSVQMAFNRLHTAMWSRREISHKTKSRVYSAVVLTILLYGCETWPLRVEDRKRLDVFDNDCLRCIEKCYRDDRVPCAVLCQRLQLANLAALLLERRLRWFGHAARRAPAEFMRELITPGVPRTWRKRTGGRLKTWATTLKVK